MTQPCARQRLTLLKVARRYRPTGRTRSGGAGRSSPAPPGRPCASESEKSPRTLRIVAPRLLQARPVPATIPKERANADARGSPQIHADGPASGMQRQRLRVRPNLASRFGAGSPVPSACICVHLRASAFPSCFVARRTGRRRAPHPPNDTLGRKVVIPLPATVPLPACAAAAPRALAPGVRKTAAEPARVSAGRTSCPRTGTCRSCQPDESGGKSPCSTRTSLVARPTPNRTSCTRPVARPASAQPGPHAP